ncbi:UNKNOWN [Stylonychia lemnae]|uniref:Uncharacterized protein n=1 Tax=Stylonychia lemnae TaxID=5949 RepID=A0A078AUA6_STYLE|nr:UNKNOWN [Stylonychia lemnae]|eukprot:CDW84423.1 UNKNOWN [Stylonychia lemnae]
MGKTQQQVSKKRKDKLFSDSEDDNEQPPKLIPIKQSFKKPEVSAILSRPVKQAVIARKQEDDDEDDESHSYDEVDSDLEIAELENDKAANGHDDDDEDMDDEKKTFEKEKIQQFAQRGINNEDMILKRIREIRANFYNRLESKRLIKKQGRVPFTEHMTITNEHPMVVPESLAVHDDIKREMAFYIMTRENVKKGMEFLVQAKLPISRPDDFFAEMLKTDQHMAKVKSRLLQQQVKIQNFEERQSRLENKKFHKAMKAYKQTEKHKEKRDNIDNINKLKKEIKEKGGEADEKEFNKLFNGGGFQKDGKKGQKQRVIDAIKTNHHQKQNKDKQMSQSRNKNKGSKQIKKPTKRPGKANRSKHKQRNKKMR